MLPPANRASSRAFLASKKKLFSARKKKKLALFAQRKDFLRFRVGFCSKKNGNRRKKTSSPLPRSKNRGASPIRQWQQATADDELPLANRASPTIFDLRRGELGFFRRFPVFFEQNPTLNRKKSFRCAKRASFFFSGRKKFFLSPKRASPLSSPYWPGANGECVVRRDA